MNPAGVARVLTCHWMSTIPRSLTMLTHGDITTWASDYVFANGIRMHYHRTGNGEKPSVVLCHGFSDNGLCWTPVARALEKDYDVFMVDARGHGLTDAPEEGYSTEDRADDVAAFVQALTLKNRLFWDIQWGLPLPQPPLQNIRSYLAKSCWRIRHGLMKAANASK